MAIFQSRFVKIVKLTFVSSLLIIALPKMLIGCFVFTSNHTVYLIKWLADAEYKEVWGHYWERKLGPLFFSSRSNTKRANNKSAVMWPWKDRSEAQSTWENGVKHRATWICSPGRRSLADIRRYGSVQQSSSVSGKKNTAQHRKTQCTKWQPVRQNLLANSFAKHLRLHCQLRHNSVIFSLPFLDGTRSTQSDFSKWGLTGGFMLVIFLQQTLVLRSSFNFLFSFLYSNIPLTRYKVIAVIILSPHWKYCKNMNRFNNIGD